MVFRCIACFTGDSVINAPDTFERPFTANLYLNVRTGGFGASQASATIVNNDFGPTSVQFKTLVAPRESA